jgi:hypothetical protein
MTAILPGQYACVTVNFRQYDFIHALNIAKINAL